MKSPLKTSRIGVIGVRKRHVPKSLAAEASEEPPQTGTCPNWLYICFALGSPPPPSRLSEFMYVGMRKIDVMNGVPFKSYIWEGNYLYGR